MQSTLESCSGRCCAERAQPASRLPAPPSERRRCWPGWTSSTPPPPETRGGAFRLRQPANDIFEHPCGPGAAAAVGHLGHARRIASAGYGGAGGAPVDRPCLRIVKTRPSWRRPMTEEFDVICIGAGPAGEALGVELKDSGLSLAVIEKSLVGGECAYFGCMPSKTLIRSAETLEEARRARELAASRVEFTVDYPKIHKRASWMARDLDDSSAAKAFVDAGHTLIRGSARLEGPRLVTVDGRELTARKAVVIATGTAPAVAKIPGIEGVDVWTNREAVHALELPDRVVVIGAGAVGVELAQAFQRFGTVVHIFESAARVLAAEEPEAGKYVEDRVGGGGMEGRLL